MAVGGLKNRTNAEMAIEVAREVLQTGYSYPPFPIEQYLADAHFAEVVFHDLGKISDGFCTFDLKRNVPIVVVNSQDTPERQRFTMAHELGHIELLHLHSRLYHISLPVDTEDSPQMPIVDTPAERNAANTFASEIVAPLSCLRAMADSGLSIDEMQVTLQCSLTTLYIQLKKARLLRSMLKSTTDRWKKDKLYAHTFPNVTRHSVICSRMRLI